MRLIALLLLPAAASALAADRGPSVAGQRQGDAIVYPIGGFDGIGLGTGASVEVRVGPTFSVRATGPAAAFDNLRVARDRDTLVIQRRFDDRRRPELERQVRFIVTMPRIDAASVGGAGRIAIDHVSGTTFDAAIGGSGDLAMNDVAVGKMRASIGGSGTIGAAGRADAIEVNIGGSGGFRGERLRAGGAQISVAGSGGVHARVEGRATVSIAGSGDVDLGPAARCSVSRVGSGRARCGN